MYLPVLIWSLVILASFWGYGMTLHRALDREAFADLGWGLAAAWGMALTLVISGVLMMLSLATVPVLASVVLAGAALAIYTIARAPRPAVSGPIHLPNLVGITLLWTLAALAFSTSMAWPTEIDLNDDLVTYLMLPKKLLATGTLIEPFSFQRAGTFGGQAILQALVMIVGDETSGHVPERGLAMVILFGILAGAMRGTRMPHTLIAFLLLVSFWLAPVPRINTNGAMTGGCLLVALLDSLDRLRTPTTRITWPGVLPSALLLAATCSIKPTFAVVILGIFVALTIARLLQPRAAMTRRAAITPLIMTGALGVAFLIPFMTVLYQSNGTPVIPPFSGFVAPGFQVYDHPTLAQNLGALRTFLLVPTTLGMLALAIPALLFAGGTERRWMIGGVAAACTVIVIRFGALAYLDLYRYLYPIIATTLLWSLAVVLRARQTALPFGRLPATSALHGVTRGGVSLFALGAFLWPNAEPGWRALQSQAYSLPVQLTERRVLLDMTPRESYQTIQQAMPVGATALTMVDAGYWLDYARNPMYGINMVGGSSPPPGIPFQHGPQALRAYLRTLGIQYVIAVDFDKAALLYTRRLWTTTTRREWFYPQIWRPYFLDVMNNIDAWDREGRVIARSGNLRLFDLQR